MLQVIRALRNGTIFTQNDIEGGITWMSDRGSASGTGMRAPVSSVVGRGVRLIISSIRDSVEGMARLRSAVRTILTSSWSASSVIGQRFMGKSVACGLTIWFE